MEPLDLTKLTAQFEDLCQQIKPFFRRTEAHQHACQYLYGLLLSPLWAKLLDPGRNGQPKCA